MRNLFSLIAGGLFLLAVVSPSLAMGKMPPKVTLDQESAPQLYIFNEMEGHAVPFSFIEEDKVCVIAFLSYECPLSREVTEELSDFYWLMNPEPLKIIGIFSMPYENNKELKTYKEQENIPFELLYDKNGILAYQLGPERAPQFFVFDQNKKLSFAGDFKGMKEAVTGLFYGPETFEMTTRVLGCPIPMQAFKFKCKEEVLPAKTNQKHFLALPSYKGKPYTIGSSKEPAFKITLSNSM